MSERKLRPMKSCIEIAKMLDAEGFTPHVAQGIRKYWMKNIIEPRKAHRIVRAIRAFREQVAPKLNQGDRFVLGKFIGIRERQAFDTGLRIGLQAFLTGSSHETQVMLQELQRRHEKTEAELHRALDALERLRVPGATESDV